MVMIVLKCPNCGSSDVREYGDWYYRCFRCHYAWQVGEQNAVE